MAFARVAEWHIGNFNTQNLANTAWAFAKVVQLDAPLFIALARAAERRVGENPQELANTAWAFATVEQLDEQLFTTLARIPPLLRRG